MNKKNNITSILNNSTNLTDIFQYYRENFPQKKFLYKKEGCYWKGETFENIGVRIDKIIFTLQKLGLNKGDRAFLLSSNRIEWVEFDIAIMSAGGITVPSFVTNNCEDNRFIINNSKPKIIILENEKIFENNKFFLKKLKLSKIIIIEKSKIFLDYNKIISKKDVIFRVPNLDKNDISSIIYTSGTIGYPKGVVLSHKSVLHNLQAAFEIIKEFKIFEDKFLSFLPLSHSYERVAGLYFPLLIGAEIFFCSSIDKLLTEIKEVKPTIFSAVPRLYENIFKKIKGRIKSSGKIESFILITIFNYIEKNNSKILLKLLSKALIKIFIERKVKRIFGGKIKALVSGGAALSPNIGLFFNKIGLKLLQGYGQTEAAPLISCNTKNLNDPKTVGFPVKNVKVKISNENEILVKGDNIMLGYWKNKKLTNSTIKNNWLHTGDLGYFDKIGRLIINGRKKDLIVTSGGDNISVQKIETMLTQQLEINQAVVYGDNKPYLIALLVVESKFNYKEIKEIINKINKKLNSLEQIRKFVLINKPFTYEDGVLTQTQKVKRSQVFSKFSNEIKKLYLNL